MLDHIENRLDPVPKPKGDSVMLLSDIIGKHGRARVVEGEGAEQGTKTALCELPDRANTAYRPPIALDRA